MDYFLITWTAQLSVQRPVSDVEIAGRPNLSVGIAGRPTLSARPLRIDRLNPTLHCVRGGTTAQTSQTCGA